MNFILYAKCTSQQEFNYTNPFFEKLKDVARFDFLDIDNFSDADLINHACKAMEIADKCCLILDLQDRCETHSFLKPALYAADHPHKCRVFITGGENAISKLLFAEDDFCYHNISENEQLAIVQKFLT